MDYTQKSPVILSYCTGIRGLERGLERAFDSLRWKRPTVAAYLEIESFICENLLCGMEAGVVAPAPIFTDIKTFPFAPFSGKIDGIIGGYPCQPFSNSGKRQGADDPRHLYPYLEQHIRAIRPVWCFFENVSGHLSLGFAEVRESLSNLGYAVEAGIFTAEEVGAPHERERLFILAIRREYLANAKSAGEWRRESHVHQQDGRQDRELQQQFDGSGAEETKLADSHGIGYAHRQPEEQSTDGRFNAQRDFTTGSEDELGNAEGELSGGLSFGKEQKQPRHQDASVAVGQADCNNKGLQGMRKCSRQEGRTASNGHIGSGRDLWPARPGEQQYEWEEPRVLGYRNRLPGSIRSMWSDSRKGFAKMLGKEVWEETEFRIKAHFEPPMDFAVNGYNVREDLLRAVGNSVVEQTAELAFRTLIEKHFTQCA